MRIIGKKIAIVTATIRRLFSRMLSQMGKVNAKYLNKEIWYVVVKTSKFLATPIQIAITSSNLQ